MPNYLGDADNYIPANPGVTPRISCRNGHCRSTRSCARSRTSSPAWSAMFGAIIILAFLPWLDNARIRSSKYRPLAKQFFWIFVVVCIRLGYLGSQPPEGIYVIAGRILTVLLLRLLPDPAAAPEPDRVAAADAGSIADDVLAKPGGKAMPTASTVIALVVAGGLLVGDARPAPRTIASHRLGTNGRSPAPPASTDRGALQRGLKVYKEVCSACHGLSLHRVPQPRGSRRSRIFG